MKSINHAEQSLHFDQQINQIENEIRALQAAMPVANNKPLPITLTASLDALFIQLHTFITLKCVSTIAPENTLIVEVIQHQQEFKILEVAKLAQLMSNHIENLDETLTQTDGEVKSTALIKQTIAEFFIARQVLVDKAINDSSATDSFCDCSTCLQSTDHQFTAAFDYVCTQCETAFFK
jgi:hypothetical protein